MRVLFFFCILKIIVVLMLSGCATHSPQLVWRDDAHARFNTAVAAGVDQFEPDESDSIRKTLQLADRFFASGISEDADSLYQLACQKSQLLYHNFILSRIKSGSTISVAQEHGTAPFELAVTGELISLKEVLKNDDSQHQPELTSASSPLQETPSVRTPASSTQSPGSGVPSSQRKKIPVQSGKSDPAVYLKQQPLQRRTTIYLTFDDGPSRLTLPIARYLKSQDVVATFFVLGNNIKGREKTVASTAALGHRIGNHTLSHNISKLKASFSGSVSEVGKTAAMIENLGGDGRLVRIPYGATDRMITTNVSSEGAQIFDWDINSYDSTGRGVKDHAYIEKSVMRQLARSGKRHLVLLFHDGAGHESTLTAIRNLVPLLKEKGYHFGVLTRNEKVVQNESPRPRQ